MISHAFRHLQPPARPAWLPQLWLGKIPETRTPNPKNPSPNPKNLNTNSGFNSRYPKLLWVIRVSTHGTRTTRKTRTTAQPKYFHSFQPSPTNLPNSLTLAADPQGPQRTPPPHPPAARGQHPPRPTQARRSGAHGRRSPPNHLSVSLSLQSSPSLRQIRRQGPRARVCATAGLPAAAHPLPHRSPRRRVAGRATDDPAPAPAGLRVGASLAEPPPTPPRPVSASLAKPPPRGALAEPVSCRGAPSPSSRRLSAAGYSVLHM